MMNTRSKQVASKKFKVNKINLHKKEEEEENLSSEEFGRSMKFENRGPARPAILTHF